MNTDDLRQALDAEAENEPVPAPDVRPRVARDVRRRRIIGVCVAIPFVVGVAIAGALVLGRAPTDASLDAAAGDGGSVPPATTVAPAAPATLDCGTMNVTLEMKSPPDLAPANCLIKALNADAAATLHVNLSAPTGGSGSVALTVTSSTTHTVVVSTHGSMTLTVPEELAGMVGLFGGNDPSSGPQTCPATTIDISTFTKLAKPDGGKPAGGAGGGPFASGMFAEFMCPLKAFQNGGNWSLVITDGHGGSITNGVTFSPDHTVSVTTDGSITVPLPADLHIPEDLLSRLTEAGIGGPGGIGGIGGMGGGRPGGAGKGHRGMDATTTTVPAGN